MLSFAVHFWSWFAAAYEAENHIPRGTIRQAVIGQANNAWELLERGEISVDEFNRKFSDDCSEIVSSLFRNHVNVTCTVCLVEILKFIQPHGCNVNKIWLIIY